MFLLFKNKRLKKELSGTLQQDKIAQNFVNRCIRVQDNSAKFLQSKFERLSLQAKKLVVIIFCSMSFGCCLFSIIESFHNHSSNAFSLTSIKVPKQVTEYQLEKLRHSIVIGTHGFEKIKMFRLYLDSLTKSKSGKALYDSIIKNRKGLIDSLTMIENIYQLNISNK